MKKILTSMLAFFMVFSIFTIVMPNKTEAQNEPKLVLTINAAEKCGATYGKNTAFLEKIEEDDSREQIYNRFDSCTHKISR